MTSRGLGTRSRERLAALLRKRAGTVTPAEAAEILRVPSEKAARLLAAWARSGWMSRVRRGLYVPVPLEASTTEGPLDDPWLVATAIFSPCYIGGWSAAEHWALTEQIFRSVCVMTTTRPRNREPNLKGTQFALRTVQESALFGLKTVWRGRTRVQVSDPARTVVDMLADPALAGGIRPAADVLKAFLRDHEKTIRALLDYGDRLDNGAIFKRLGFLLESEDLGHPDLVAACRKRLRSGYVKLDPSIPVPRLVTAWGLWVPKRWTVERSRD